MECEVCGDEAVGLFVCSACANDSSDKSFKAGARNELKRLMQLHKRKPEYIIGNLTEKYIEKRLKELGK